MKFGSVCSGIEAASVAWNKLGWSASWLAEIEPFPSAVLAHHYPDVPNLGDMTLLPAKILSKEIEAPDVFCGGTPCQAFSIAGNRESLDDARGNLSLTFCEIANAIDSVRTTPAIIFWENVPGVLNTKDNAFGCFLGELAGEDGELKPSGKKWTNAGCVFGPKRAVAWRVLDAQYFGLAQRRKRVFVVASARNDFNPAEVLFEFDGLRRDTAPGRNSREDITELAGTLPASGGGLDRPAGQGNELDFCVTGFNKQRIGEYSTEDVASTCAARDYKDATDLVTYENFKTVYEMHAQDARVQNVGDVLPTMSATYGSGGGNIPVTYGIQSTVIGRKPENGPQGSGYSEDISFTQTKTDVHAVAYNITFCDANGTRKDRPDGGLYVNETDVSNALTNAGVGTNVLHTMSEIAGTLDASYYKGQGSRQGGEREFVAQSFAQNQLGEVRVGDVFNTLNTNSNASGRNTPMLMTQMAVRRLTPTECERLQGFPKINETIRVEICFDHQKSVVTVEIKCRKSQSNALSVGESESKQLVSIANWNFNTNQADQEPLVALHVHQQSGGRSLVLRNAQKLTTFASSAEKPSSSPLFTQAESFVATLVRIQQTLALTTSIGKEASHPSISLSLTEPHGNQNVGTFEGVTEDCVSDANCAVNEARFTISSRGHVTVICDSQIATLLCSVMTATSGFIQNGILPESFSVELTTLSDYTAIPWKNKDAKDCPDGLRYKALGNSWAVPVITWIGERIVKQLQK